MLKRSATGAGASKPSSSATGKSGFGSGKSGLTSSGGKSGLTSGGGKSGLISSGGKSGLISSSGKSGLISSGGKSGLTSGVGKNTDFPLSTPFPGKHKSSTGFGVIWIPGRRHNRQKKDKFYNSLKDDYSKPKDHPHNYFMSGDSPATQLYKEDASSEKTSEATHAPPTAGGVLAETITATATVAEAGKSDDMITTDDSSTSLLPPEVDHENDNKDAAGDAKEEEKEFLENEQNKSLKEVVKSKDQSGDTMDHVQLRPPPEKAQEATEVPESEEDRCVTCLYYTLECCDCSIM